jgi:hypothetical protein
MSFEDSKLAAALRDIPEVKAAHARAIEEEIATRRSHLAAIAKLDAQGEKSYAKEEARKAASLVKVRQAERDLQTVIAEYNAVLAGVSSERREREDVRRRHELALLDGDWKVVDLFENDCLTELERVRRSGQSQILSTRNARTGRSSSETVSNSNSVRARLEAVSASFRAAGELRLIPDPHDLPARIAEIKASWPRVDDIPADKTEATP